MRKNCLAFWGLVLCCTVAKPVMAGVGLSQTRMVINEQGKSTTINARNTDKTPYLVANFITEKLESKAQLDGIFVITPMVFRIEPESQNAIKIQVISSSLPKDRESLYYFHSRNVPSNDGPKAGMQVGIENVIKIFFRPKNLVMSPNTAFSSVKFIATEHGVKASNSSPYHINLNNVSINNVPIKLNTNNAVIAPFSTMDFMSGQRSGMVKWAVINDLGGVDEFTQSVN